MIPSENILNSAGRSEAEDMLLRTFAVRAAVGERSAKAAYEAASQLFGGDVWGTIKFMNRRAPGLGGERPIDVAEQSEEGLNKVLNLIGAIEAGVYV